MSTPNEFETLFQQTFPDIYRLHVLGKPQEEGGGGEVHIWKVVEALLDAHTEQSTLKLEISLDKGRIVSVKRNEEIIANKASRPHY